MFYKLIFHISHVLNSFTGSNRFCIGSLDFLGRREAHLKERTVLCWRVAVRVDMLVLFLVFMGMCFGVLKEKPRQGPEFRSFIWNWTRTQREPGREEMPVHRYATEGTSGGNRSPAPPPRTLQKASPNSLSEEGKAGVLSIGPGSYWWRADTPTLSGQACTRAKQALSALQAAQQQSEDVCGAGLRGGCCQHETSSPELSEIKGAEETGRRAPNASPSATLASLRSTRALIKSTVGFLREASYHL